MALVDNPHLAAVRDSEPALWLSASPELARSARAASQCLFNLLHKYVPNIPLDRLLTDGYDAEQIWQQIEIRDKALFSSLRRQLQQLESAGAGATENGDEDARQPLSDEDDEVEDGEDEVEDGGNKAEDEEGSDLDAYGDDIEEASEDEKQENQDAAGVMKNVEDEFLKMKDMEQFLEDAEKKHGAEQEDGSDEDEDHEMEGSDEGISDEIRYEDFFVKKKGEKAGKKVRFEIHEDEDHHKHNEEYEESDGEGTDEENQDITENGEGKSTHEKKLEKIQKRIKHLEEQNLNVKDWTMQGEVTAKKRPKNSALEVELDFEHNVRPAPVITEEVTASIEDIIRKRIIEGKYDDVERKIRLPEAPPAEKIEIDETKSKKGLGEIYEAEYMQSTGLASAPASEAEVLRKEAAALFKSLCVKLDALSHFHFAPKPVLEDMSIKEDVPALAMEEVAPVSVTDASMLAPEEVFKGTGAIKEDKELTPTERKQLRAAKKRKRNTQRKQDELRKKKPRADATEVAPTLAIAPKKRTSEYAKSSKVFAELDRLKTEGSKPSRTETKTKPASSFKL